MIEFTFIIFLLAVGALISIKLPEEKAKRFWLVPKIWKYLGEPIRNYKLKNITYNKVVLGYFSGSSVKCIDRKKIFIL